MLGCKTDSLGPSFQGICIQLLDLLSRNQSHLLCRLRSYGGSAGRGYWSTKQPVVRTLWSFTTILFVYVNPQSSPRSLNPVPLAWMPGEPEARDDLEPVILPHR